MRDQEKSKTTITGSIVRNPASAFCIDQPGTADTIPIWLINARDVEAEKIYSTIALTKSQVGWLKASGFTAAAGLHALVPSDTGAIAAVLFGIGDGDTGEPCGPGELLLGLLAKKLPDGDYHLAQKLENAELATIAWGLGAYSFTRYKGASDTPSARLQIPQDVDSDIVLNTVEAIWLGRDLVNTPASDLGPVELEDAARELAKRHGAQVTSTVGDDLLKNNFPMIHAVGRASPSAPRLIDLVWRRKGGHSDAPRITVVGKGICFDTGGLDLKPAAGMLLMKKDMGGAATALALAHMIMGRNLDVRLRVLIPAAENSVAGNAFRPSDILFSRAGLTVEVGNTDAEGRLVLADALSYADEEAPDLLISLATLTGSARVALGPDLPAMFCDSDEFAQTIHTIGCKVGDPVWRMPFWPGYDKNLDSDVADINNISSGPFAGAVTAALFLKRFVKRAHTYAHIDLYGWRPHAKALGPKGGEPHTARTLLKAVEAGSIKRHKTVAKPGV